MCTNFKGVIFDMDGTLTVPAINFDNIRKELDIEKGRDLLDIAKSMSSHEKVKYFNIIHKYEELALEKLEFQVGARDMLKKLKNLGIKLAIITRNSQKNTDIVLKKLDIEFDPILTREFRSVKPNPEPIHFIVADWKFALAEVLMVGDFRDDILCGKNAGVKTCFYENKNKESYAHLADFSVNNYLELEKQILNYNL